MFTALTFSELLTAMTNAITPYQDVLLAIGFIGAITYGALRLRKIAK